MHLGCGARYAIDIRVRQRDFAQSGTDRSTESSGCDPVPAAEFFARIQSQTNVVISPHIYYDLVPHLPSRMFKHEE